MGRNTRSNKTDVKYFVSDGNTQVLVDEAFTVTDAGKVATTWLQRKDMLIVEGSRGTKPETLAVLRLDEDGQPFVDVFAPGLPAPRAIIQKAIKGVLTPRKVNAETGEITAN